jgi:sporulation protein YlmC with PRC-barrel domain
MSASWMMTSTDLVGMKIRDRYGDEIGNVDNLLVNPQTGDVEAVVVWAGGWVFGIGGEKVAVPYWAFEPRPREEYMVINATQRQLTASPSFSDQNWREQVDRQWSQRLDSYWSDVIEGAPATTGVYEPAVYPQEPTRPRIMLVQDWGNEPSAQSGDWFEEEKAWQSETRAQEDDWLADRQAWQKEPREHEQEWFEDEAWGGEDEAAMPAEDWTQQEQAWPHTYEAGDLMLVSEVVGAKLRTSNGEEFGQIANVLVDSRYGKAAYAVVSYGGVLGLGQAMTVVPWTAMDFRGPDQDAYVTADAQTLKRFEFSNLSEMPDVTNHAEAQRIHRAYAAQPYWHGERPVAQERAQRFGRKWNSPPMQTNGTIEEVATFTWQNAQTHTGTKLMVKTPDGEMVTVLVAPESYVKQQQMDFTKGQQVTVTGWQGRLHGEQVLSAQKIQMAEKTFALRDQYGQPQWSGRYRLEQMDFAQEGFSDNPLIEAKGQIQQVSDFTWQAQGLSHTGKQFTLKTDDGQMMTVLVAPTSYLQRRQIQFQQGREATVSGWQSQHHGQPVIVARTVETDERMLTLRDRQGAPEWPAPLARRLARGPLMETKGRIEQVSQFQWQSGGQTYTGEQMIVQTDEGDRVTVLVAPTQFLQQRNIRLWPGEQVMVRGWQSTFRGEQVLTARTIETQEKTIVLRDRRGRPEWSGWQPMQRPTTS